ncbi:MAG: hypothetical protein NTX25_21645, partial [Proteobacteria bacterium]|nr:hypothetical protein [Pseudomonadota bacterium]
AGNEMLQDFHYEHLHNTGYAGVWGWAYFYVRESNNAGSQTIRKISKHENQDYFRQILKNMPTSIKYPVHTDIQP